MIVLLWAFHLQAFPSYIQKQSLLINLTLLLGRSFNNISHLPPRSRSGRSYKAPAPSGHGLLRNQEEKPAETSCARQLKL
jgi:hypothetical protein